jgi:hypothetical protein
MMNINAWGDGVGLAGLLSIGIMVAGLFCLLTMMTVGALLQKLTGRENAITRQMKK